MSIQRYKGDELEGLDLTGPLQCEAMGVDARGYCVRVEGTPDGVMVTVGDEERAKRSMWSSQDIEWLVLKDEIERLAKELP